MMRKILAMAAATLTAAILAGCQQQAKPGAAAHSVLDVSPAKTPSPEFAYSSQRVIPPDEPKVPMATGPLTTVTPGFNSTPAAPGAHADKNAKSAKTASTNSYKVKKGDTLYHIAKSEYGDGKKWTLIASANPGVSPNALKAGQTLRIP